MHIASRPRPRYRMSKEAIIFRPTGIEVIDHLLFTRPIPTVKLMGCKTSEQQLCLIQPGSMCWGYRNPNLWLIETQKFSRVPRDVTRAAIPNQMNASGLAILVKELGQDAAQLVTVVGGQTPTAHFAAMYNQRCQKVDGPVSDVFKLPALNFAGSHQARRQTPLQDLNVGLLIQRQDDFVTLKEPIHPFVEPQNARSTLSKLIIQDRSLPVPRAMRLQRSRTQNQRDSRMRNPRDNASLDSDSRQRPCRPMGHLQTDARRSATGQLLNLDSLQGGKSPTADRTVGHQRWLRCPALRNVGRAARWQLALPRLYPTTVLRRSPGQPWLTGCVRDAPLVVRCDHHAPGFQVAAGLVLITRSNVGAVSSYAITFPVLVFV
jgi:hypothetical protein